MGNARENGARAAGRGGRMLRRRPAAALAVAVAGLVLTGCAGGGTGGGATGDTVRIALDSGIDTMDPLAAVRQSEIWVHHLVGGTLFAYVPGSAEVEPGLAESIERSADGLTVTVSLRADNAFSDGSPLTSADVVASFERAKETELVANDEVFGSIDEVTADGEDSVVFRLRTPRGDFETQLAQPRATIYPVAVAEGSQDFADAPQSGRYAFESDPLAGGSNITLARNTHYAGSQPEVDTLEFQLIADTATSVLRLQAGDVDVVPSVLPAQYEELARQYAVTNTATSDVQMMTYNLQAAPVDDPRVRRAIGLAVDREQLATVGYAGLAEPVLGAYPDGFADVDEPQYATSPQLDEARELLEGTACESGCTIEIISFASSANVANMVASVSEALQPLGITIVNSPVEDATFVDRNMNGDYQAAVVNFTGPTLAGFVTSTLNPDGGLGAAFTGWANPAAAAVAPTTFQASGDERADAQSALAAIWAEDAPWVPLVSVPLLTASDPDFAEVVLFNKDGFLDIASAAS